MTYAEREKARKAKWRKEHPEYGKLYAAQWRKSHPDYAAQWRKSHPDYAAQWRKSHPEKVAMYAAKHGSMNERIRKWRAENPEKHKAQRKAYLKAHPEYNARAKRVWRERYPDKAKAQDRRCAKRRWLKIIDSYELHEAHLLKRHNQEHPNTPYRPRHKARRPPTWMMHRALWEYAGGEPTPEQKAYALALFRSRRAQRFGEREEIE